MRIRGEEQNSKSRVLLLRRWWSGGGRPSHAVFINRLVYTSTISDVFDSPKTETVFVDSFERALAFRVRGISPGGDEQCRRRSPAAQGRDGRDSAERFITAGIEIMVH